MSQKISQLTAVAALAAADQLELSQLSTTVLITAATISAAAADNSYNDSGNGFVTAGFVTGDQVSVAGFTGSGANNIYSATVTAVAAGKLTIGGTDGNVIVDDAAGETVTITKWQSRRLPISTLYEGARGSSGGIFKYEADTTGTTGDPGAGDIRWNNATQASATQINLSHLTDDGVDIDLFLELIAIGDVLVVQDQNDSLNYQTWEVSGAPVAFPHSYFEFPVTLNASGGTGTTNFANNHNLIVIWLRSGAAGLLDVMIFRGVINCSGNPNYPAADAGAVYKVSVAGKIGGASGPNVEAGDTLYCTTDGSAAGDHATVGANWGIGQVNVDGAVVGPASAVDNTLPRFDGATGKLLQGSAVVLSDADELSGYKGNVNTQAGTTYTLVAADSGKIVDHANAAAITVTLPNNLPKGFLVTYVQAGAGQITFSPQASGTLVNRITHTKTAGQHAAVTLFVRSNSGVDALWVLCGDTGS
jgi:hypothetical protein